MWYKVRTVVYVIINAINCAFNNIMIFLYCLPLFTNVDCISFVLTWIPFWSILVSGNYKICSKKQDESDNKEYRLYYQ